MFLACAFPPFGTRGSLEETYWRRKWERLINTRIVQV